MNNDDPFWSPTSTIDSFNFAVPTPSQLDFTYTFGTMNNLFFTTNTTWSFLNNYYEWPKGVSDQSFEKKYTPKWHTILGYKAQMKIMWD